MEKTADSAWRYTEIGENRFGLQPTAFVDHTTIDALAARSPEALALLLLIERHHASAPNFVLAKAMANNMGWTLPRWRAARDQLIKAGRIKRIHTGGRGPKDPHLYCLT